MAGLCLSKNSLIAPFPNNPNPAEDFDPTRDKNISCQGLMWYARLQLFFNCTVCPTERRARKNIHMELSLVFFSAFEPINITLCIESLLRTTSLPRHSSPGGHVLQSSVVGLRMYCPALHGLHSCRSSEPVLAVVSLLKPPGQLVSAYRPVELSRAQLPMISPPSVQFSSRGPCSPHDLSRPVGAHGAPGACLACAGGCGCWIVLDVAHSL